MPLRRIIIRGTTGSGKTTLSRQLANRLQIPATGLDNFYWQPNWTPTPDAEFIPKVEQYIAHDQWVLEGNYDRVQKIVVPRADTLLWLDYPFPLTFYRLFRRTITRAVTRQHLYNGCHENLRQAFLSRDSILVWCIKTHGTNHRRANVLFADPPSHLQLHRFTHPRQTQAWFDQLPQKTD